MIQNFLQGDAAHGFLCSGLYQVVTVPQYQLNVHAHAASGVGVDVLMKQGLVALYCPIGIQQSDFLRLTSQSGSGMSLHADQQPSLPQGGHELAHIGRIRLNALCQLVTGQVAVWVQSDKSQNMNSIAKAVPEYWS